VILEEKMKIDIMICTKDRPSEIGLLLQSLRSQTHQDWDLFIMDDRSGTPLTNHHFIRCLINLLKQENHRVFVLREVQTRYGVTKLRQKLVDKIMKIGQGESILRLDDDNILNSDYVEKLVDTLNAGYDIASGLVPVAFQPTPKRETKFVKPFIADIKLNKEGLIESFGDDCGWEYIESEIIPSPHFRSMALIRKSVHEKVKYESSIGFCSFREEEFFSFRAIIAGFKIAVHTGAIAYHLLTPSGGERTPEFQNNLDFNHGLLNKFTQELFRENGDFIAKYKEQFK